MKSLSLFTIAAALHPNRTTDVTGADTTPEPTILVQPKAIFACSEAHAKALLTQEITPDLLAKRPDEVRLYIATTANGVALC